MPVVTHASKGEDGGEAYFGMARGRARRMAATVQLNKELSVSRRTTRWSSNSGITRQHHSSVTILSMPSLFSFEELLLELLLFGYYVRLTRLA